MPRLPVPTGPKPLKYAIQTPRLIKRAKVGGLPIATEICLVATPERTATASVQALWDDWLATVGYKPSPLPRGSFVASNHTAEECRVVTVGHDPIMDGPHEPCELALGRPYPRSSDNLDGYGNPIPGLPERGRKRAPEGHEHMADLYRQMEAELAAAHRLLACRVKSFVVTIPGRRKPGNPTWRPAVTVMVYARSKGDALVRAVKPWIKASMEEIRDARAMGQFPYPFPDPEIDPWFVRGLPVGATANPAPYVQGTPPCRLPGDPNPSEIRDRHAMLRVRRAEEHRRNGAF